MQKKSKAYSELSFFFKIVKFASISIWSILYILALQSSTVNNSDLRRSTVTGVNCFTRITTVTGHKYVFKNSEITKLKKLSNVAIHICADKLVKI